jgi:NAD(P)-dependent dehydrogenase (short-subunit alcohol dehydrogenase family)
MPKGLFDCSGKVTMVTGGNGGIGLGFAMGCAKMGGDIAIWARNAEKNAAAKVELLAAGAGRVETYVVDVSTEDAIVAGYEQLNHDFGRLDCVFANSGASPRYNSVFEMPTEHWFEFQKVALHGAFFTLREGARLMVARAKAGEPGGSLVACGSLSLFQGLPGKMEYAASKCATGAVIRALAVELGEYN